MQRNFFRENVMYLSAIYGIKFDILQKLVNCSKERFNALMDGDSEPYGYELVRFSHIFNIQLYYLLRENLLGVQTEYSQMSEIGCCPIADDYANNILRCIYSIKSPEKLGLVCEYLEKLENE